MWYSALHKWLTQSIGAQVPITRGIVIFVLCLVALVTLLSPPLSFPEEALIRVPEGTSVEAIGDMLHDEKILRFPYVFRALVTLRGVEAELKAGDYLFKSPIGVLGVVSRLHTGDFGLEPVRVRLAEGMTRAQMARQLEASLPYFSTEAFLAYTEGKEGYLFPDTYFFLPNATAHEVADQLEATFYDKTKPLRIEVAVSPYSLHEIVTMASLIEREAYDSEDRRLIASVLWNRLAIAMPLQVDATLFFLLGKPSSELTRDDLATDSPYNTYAYPGLPPGPIASPSLDALEAALHPTSSDYLYYLSDEDGTTHFATTFEGHKENRALYLD